MVLGTLGVHFILFELCLPPAKGALLVGVWVRQMLSPTPAKLRFQLQSFARRCAETFVLGLRLAPSGMCPSGLPGSREPGSRPPFGTLPAALGDLPPPAPTDRDRSPLLAWLSLLCAVPFCLLDPWPPKLQANRSEAPLAFRMKNEDFLNSLGHSCIRSGPCAFPMQRVKFIVEGLRQAELENGYFPLVLTQWPPSSDKTRSSNVLLP